jgi:hypothetical protein
MSVTININNLSLVHKGSSGIAMATIPDVCKTPTPGGPVPIPYANIAYSSDLSKGTKSVEADGGNSIAIKGSEFSKSICDEPGTIGGVKSGTNMKEATWLIYSFDVQIESNNACRLTDKMLMNHGNTVCMGGEFQALVGAVGLDDTLQVLCEIFCGTRKEGHDFKKNPANKGKRFNYSKRAKEIAETKYKSALKKLGNFIPEKTVLVSVSKGALGKTARKIYSQAALKKRLLKEAAEAAGKKLAKGFAKKAVLKFIPGLNVLSLALDVYDVATTGYEVYKMVDEFLESYDTFRIRPDMAQFGPDGEIQEIYDYKFDYPDGSADSMSAEQRKLYREKAGKDPKVVDQEKCKCK